MIEKSNGLQRIQFDRGGCGDSNLLGRLSGMANALIGQNEQPGSYAGLAFDERLQLLTDSEQQDRNQRKQQRLIKTAQFKIAANSNDIDYQHPRGLKQSMVANLLQCDWINHHQNLLLTSPCGSGKTYITCVLGHTGCLKGYRVKYYQLSRLLLESFCSFIMCLRRRELIKAFSR